MTSSSFISPLLVGWNSTVTCILSPTDNRPFSGETRNGLKKTNEFDNQGEIFEFTYLFVRQNELRDCRYYERIKLYSYLYF